MIPTYQPMSPMTLMKMTKQLECMLKPYSKKVKVSINLIRKQIKKSKKSWILYQLTLWVKMKIITRNQKLKTQNLKKLFNQENR